MTWDQVLGDQKVLRSLIDILVNFTDVYKQLRQRAKAGYVRVTTLESGDGGGSHSYTRHVTG